MSQGTGEHRRTIRSFVLRQGRMTVGQRQAFERLWPLYGLDLRPGTVLDPARLFVNDHPTCLEIGFGNGDALAAMATAHPERNYLGIEVHRPGVGHLLLALEKKQLGNVRVLCHDAVEVLEQALPDNCLDALYLFFPDPWPKQRHHKRRIVQPPLLNQAARVLCPGGLLHLATDWKDYARHMLIQLRQCPDLENTSVTGDFVPRPEGRPLTRFEHRGHRLGHGVWDLVFRRR